MNLKRTIGLILVIAGVILGVAKALGGQGQSGDWTLRRSDDPGKVEFSLMDSRAGHQFHNSSDWPASDFSGLDFSKSGRQEVHFTIARDAGKFECQGFLQDGEGAGLFHFLAEPKYSLEMKSLGFEVIDGDKQWTMAIHDVSLKFARDIKAENLQGLDTDKLVAFKIHGVIPEFIRHSLSGCKRFRQRQTHCFPHSWRVSGIRFGDSLGGAECSGQRQTHGLPHSRGDTGNGAQPQTGRL